MAGNLRLPAAPRTTHDTAGLPGFPAVDEFANPGTQVLAPVSGQIVDVHMIPWNQKARVGGETAYLQGDDGKTYFLTHLAGNVPSGRVSAGQPIGAVAAVPGGWWQSHIHEGVHQGIYQPGGSSAPAVTPAQAWPTTAVLAYNMGLKAGLTPAQAKDFAAVQHGESGFDANSRNPHSGAAGLYQLLSPGYVATANRLGGVFNPVANIQAILPDYVKFYRTHPNAAPGEAGAAVEKSGEPASYYAQGYNYLPGLPGKTAATTAVPKGAPVSAPASAPAAVSAARAAAPPPVAPPAVPPAASAPQDNTDLALSLLTQTQPAPFQPTPAPIGSTNIPAVHIEAPNAGTSPPVVQAIRLAQLHAQDSAGPSSTASFAKWLHNADGLTLPGTLHGQLTAGTEATTPLPQARDLLFFGNGAPTHQGISVGGHNFVHFSNGGRTIHISTLANPHYGTALRSVRSLF